MLVAAGNIASIGKAIRTFIRESKRARLKTWQIVELIEADPIDQLLDHQTSAVRLTIVTDASRCKFGRQYVPEIAALTRLQVFLHRNIAKPVCDTGAVL
jgi:hypothetical protein